MTSALSLPTSFLPNRNIFQYKMKNPDIIFRPDIKIDYENKLSSENQYYHNYSLQFNRWLLKPIGVWPNSNKIISGFNICICTFFLCAWFVPGILNMTLEENDKNIIIKRLGPMLYCFMSGVKYVSLIFHRGNLELCINHMKGDWKLIDDYENRTIMFANARIGRYLVAFSTIFIHTGVMVYSLVMAAPAETLVIDNQTVVIKLVPYAFYNKIIDSRVSPGYDIVFAVQCISGFVINSVTAGCCSTATIFVSHATGQLKILILWLKNFVDGRGERNDDTLEKRMICIVEHHIRVLSFIARVEHVMNFIFLIEVVGCTFIICLIGYYSLTEWEENDAVSLLSYSILLISFTFNIFISCLMGEILTEQCSKIGNAVYMTEWYRLPHKSALGLILILSRSSKVIRMTAGKFIHLSIASFGDVIRSSVFYLNILRTVTM